MVKNLCSQELTFYWMRQIIHTISKLYSILESDKCYGKKRIKKGRIREQGVQRVGMCDSFIKVTQDLIKKLSFEQILERFEGVNHMIIREKCVPVRRISQCKSPNERVYLYLRKVFICLILYLPSYSCFYLSHLLYSPFFFGLLWIRCFSLFHDPL